MDVTTARSLLENSKIMVFNGHGSPSVITIHEKPQSYIHNYHIYDPTDVNNSLDLSGTDIVFFAGCSTGGNPCDYCDEKGKHEGHFVDMLERKWRLDGLLQRMIIIQTTGLNNSYII